MPKKTIRGFIHEPPDMHFTSTGKAVTTLYLFKYLYADKSDEDKPLRITAWQELAEACAYKLKPNDELYLSGHFRTNTWVGQDKQVHSQEEFTAQKVWLIEGSGVEESFTDIMILELEEEQESMPIDTERVRIAMPKIPRVLNKRNDPIPKGAVYVGRPSKWGNPFHVGALYHNVKLTQQLAVEAYQEWLLYSDAGQKRYADINELRGKDLVCWCAPLPCHANILLELANA